MKIKLSLFLSIFFGSCLSLSAQNAVWQLHPEYDQLDIVEDVFCIGHKKVMERGEEKDSVFFWEMNGKLIAEGENLRVASYHDGVCVVLDADSLYVRGVLNKKGFYQEVPIKREYLAIDEDPCFNNGFLRIIRNGEYYFIDKNCQLKYGPFPYAYPFFQGVALVSQYENAEKKKGAVFDYISAEGNLLLPGVDRSEIDFASSVNEEGYAIVALGKKVSKYDIKSGTLTQLTTDGSEDKKKRVTTLGSHPNLVQADSLWVLPLKQGDMRFNFDRRLREINYTDMPQKTINPIVVPPYEFKSNMTYTIDSISGLYGLYYGDVEFLPAQFDDVDCLAGNLAVVSKNDKYGLLLVHPNDSIEFRINNNKKIDFLHSTYQTDLVAMMPTYMKAKLGRIIPVNSENECEILNTTRTNRENEEVTALEYKCNLTIPYNLPIEEVCSNYDFQLNYDGIISRPYVVCASMWYVTQYEVEIPRKDFTIEANAKEIEVEFQLAKNSFVVESDNINHSLIISVENNYANDTIPKEIYYTKIRENLYSFKIPIPDGGKDQLSFNIKLNEEGCPCIVYPHTITISQGKEAVINQSKKVVEPSRQERTRVVAPPKQTYRAKQTPKQPKPRKSDAKAKPHVIRPI